MGVEHERGFVVDAVHANLCCSNPGMRATPERLTSVTVLSGLRRALPA
jgi:hypothetical protein